MFLAGIYCLAFRRLRCGSLFFIYYVAPCSWRALLGRPCVHCIDQGFLIRQTRQPSRSNQPLQPTVATGESLTINGRPVLRESIREEHSAVIFTEKIDQAIFEIAFAQSPKQQPPDTCLTVPPDQFFVTSDNRFNAYDSRYFGPTFIRLDHWKKTVIATAVTELISPTNCWYVAHSMSILANVLSRAATCACGS
jgi:hypothetical protein